jgi:hypothetical protein
MVELGIGPGAAFESALVGIKLMRDSPACWRELFARADPTESISARTRSSLIHAPAFF